MKEISVSLWEITPKEIENLRPDTQVLMYNSFIKNYNVMTAEKLIILNLNYDIPQIHYFTFTEPELKNS